MLSWYQTSKKKVEPCSTFFLKRQDQSVTGRVPAVQSAPQHRTEHPLLFSGSLVESDQASAA
ncbi:MAG: hypothetical protein CSH37_02260 [Thalassolituus sp.]|nr:MAG: hypothetical protein CSH37_02260 [Thalassolituus sp.]